MSRLMGAIQGVLLATYRGVRRSGIFETQLGRAAFEGAYWTYKSLVEARDLELLRPYVAPGSTVVDVGANIGFFTVSFARWAGPSGRVVAIEPERANVDSLRARVARLGLDRGVDLVHAAAIEAPGQVFLRLNPDHPADHRVAASGLPVQGVSLDSLLASGGRPAVSLIKIDVQGGELRVLRGARDTIAAMRPALFVEFQEDCLVEAGTSPAELLEHLVSIGYRPHALDQARRWREVDSTHLFGQMRERGYLDVLFLVDGKAAA